MKRDDGVILVGLFAAVLFFVLLRLPFPSKNPISLDTIHSLPESVVMVYLDSAQLPIQGIYDKVGPNEVAIPENVSVIGQALVEREEGYTWVSFARPEDVFKGGIEWEDIALFGSEEGINAFFSSSANNTHTPSSLPKYFQQEGTILMRSSFLVRIMPGIEYIQDDGWAGVRYSPISSNRGVLFDLFSRSNNGTQLTTKNHVQGNSRTFVEIFLPTDDSPVVPGTRLSSRFEKNVQEAFMIEGVRVDALVPPELPQGVMRLQGLEEGRQQIQEIRSYLASHAASFVLLDQDDILHAALYVELQEGDAQILKPLILDVIRKKVSLLHASQKTVSTESGRLISHVLPHADPDMFIERDLISGGVVLRIPCGTAPLFLDMGDCAEHSLVVALDETMVLISNNTAFVERMIEYPRERRTAPEARIFIDRTRIEQHEEFDIITNMISETYGVGITLPEIIGIEGEMENVEGGLVFRGTIW